MTILISKLLHTHMYIIHSGNVFEIYLSIRTHYQLLRYMNILYFGNWKPRKAYWQFYYITFRHWSVRFIFYFFFAETSHRMKLDANQFFLRPVFSERKTTTTTTSNEEGKKQSSPRENVWKMVPVIRHVCETCEMFSSETWGEHSQEDS